VPDDRGIREEPTDVGLAEARHRIRLEALERGPEALALAQDGQPRQTRLEAFEAESLVDPALAGDGPAPFLVVVGQVERVGRLPAANQAIRQLRP
jgi:hypothetical protein